MPTKIPADVQVKYFIGGCTRCPCEVFCERSGALDVVERLCFIDDVESGSLGDGVGSGCIGKI